VGSTEHVKGLLRHYLAKGADLRRYDQGTRDDIADRLNRRPQRTLNCNHHQEPRVCPCRGAANSAEPVSERRRGRRIAGRPVPESPVAAVLVAQRRVDGAAAL
jgi:hypothetical protein